jgi:hypothetical protein
MARSSISDLVASTEAEIFSHAAEADEALLTDDDIADEDLDEVEGWNGEPLFLEEIAAAAAQADPNNNDRPLALRTEQEQTAELIALDKAILAQGQQFEADRKAMEWAEKRRELSYELLLPEKEAAIDQIVQQRQEIDRLNEARLNDHLNVTAERYGKERFEAAHNYLTSLPVNNVTRALVREIIESPDPGAAIIDFYEGGGGSGGGSRMPPSLNSQTPAAGRGGRGGGRYGDWATEAQDYKPYSAERAEEESVFNDVWR